ncbi:MAG: hypothetical protein ABL971_13800 [Vicinamibacterales bacterium]
MPPVSALEEIRETFAAQRYVKIDSLIEDGLARMLYDHVMRSQSVASPARMSGQDGAVEMFSDPLMEHVLSGVQPRVEQLSGLVLDPTYSFFRIYRRGNLLEPHLDRAACEISVSLNLGPKLETPWPLHMKGPLGQTAVAMQPGDAVFYFGIECPHWRDPLESDHSALVFLHYVERGGRYADWKFDKRSSLGAPHVE